jgi:hypothetical protein
MSVGEVRSELAALFLMRLQTDAIDRGDEGSEREIVAAIVSDVVVNRDLR